MRDKIYPILHLDTNKSQGTTPKNNSFWNSRKQYKYSVIKNNH